MHPLYYQVPFILLLSFSFFFPISFFCFCPNRKWVSLPFIGMDILEALCFYREGKIRNIFEIGGLLLQSFYNSILKFCNLEAIFIAEEGVIIIRVKNNSMLY
ncbi:AQG_2a_G0054840.mRNA.1.CDS.1 [Saccharomyces cerevisiae]|nr:HLJ1_G0023070.mRNA.1.CDS.1 [Saccharomyces cerevisiae]CAI4820892.1 BAI_1a_G0053930.mRNA.1.CDS.1 [Saccharomyces cerevisiae]CAI4824643.1 CCN_G0054010.mRNA.1.CDS.1 [Saccharomyces cerevisiae]CAI4847990.1 AQG_2a_G0054840.mRNA.1.CDS.1 [Saccharomyces cerevisiae]CAI4851438.1 CCT_1a_G0055150.mRNA.1.CDS.1 [Saccharomyces cerevisiae]